jgi:ABC-type nitrate/sulfonate/bicarbonate transport system ATPase subunit
VPAPLLEVAITGKHFAGDPPRAVLGAIAFSAGPGETLAILAPSGTGKSTLLALILGLDTAYEGSIVRPPDPPGVVFQDPRLVPWLTVRENLRLVAELTDPDITALLDAVRMSGIEGLLPGELSLGMARRVALARALAIRPSWLVLDEPFASLDASLAAELARRLADGAKGHARLVLFATHELDTALAIADRILVLAGAPARLAADVRVPALRGAFAQQLRAQFPFLAGHEAP